MKLLIAIVVVMANALAISANSIAYYSPLRSIVYPAAHLYSAHSSSLLTPTQQQYHTQDEFGQYAYGYSEPLSAKEEVRSLDGTTRGSYSYRDADGKLQTVAYTADSNGFHVAATNLPRAGAVTAPKQSNAASASAAVASASTDTVEITAARENDFAAYKAAQLRLAASESAATDNSARHFSANTGHVRSVELPNPVEDTPAVAYAKAEHLKRFEQEKFRNEIIGASAAAVAVAANQPATLVRSIIPAVYNYGHPLNTRLLAAGYIY